MAGPRLCQWLSFLLCSLLLLKIEGGTAPIFYVESGVAKGAVCLDGTPPAYHWDKGTGDGINNWLVHFEGGGWCNNATSCLGRRRSRLGSSTPMMKKLAFSGILNTQQRFNPDFYNWNKVKIGYCDGSSFTGDVEEVDSETKLYYRGARVWQAVLDDLLAKGMKNAKMALLSGCSAGGLSSLIHCDEFRAALPADAKVKCLSDAGYFLDAKDISGGQTIEGYFSQVAETHGSAKHLPSSCTSRLKPELCFFPQNFADHIQTPVFLVNADIDSWQIKNILVPDGADTSGEWASCKLDVKNCSPDQIKTMQGFREQFISAVNGLRSSSSNGLYIQSCYSHCQTEMQETWLMDGSPLLDKKAVATAVADWFYDRSPFKVIDCPYPCNPTCHNRVFEAKEISDL